MGNNKFGVFTQSFAGSRQIHQGSPKIERINKKITNLYQDNQPI